MARLLQNNKIIDKFPDENLKIKLTHDELSKKSTNIYTHTAHISVARDSPS